MKPTGPFPAAVLSWFINVIREAKIGAEALVPKVVPVVIGFAPCT